jgi:AraC family transcriptional regulator, transcriptional activator of pobA
MEKNKLTNIIFKTLDYISVSQNFVVSDSSSVPYEIRLNTPYSFDGLMLGICKRGIGGIQINYKEYEVSVGDVFIIPPHYIFEPLNKTDDYFLEFLLFSPDFFTDLPFPNDYNMIEHMTKSPIIRLSASEMEDVLVYHSIILKSYNREKDMFTSLIVKSLLFSLLLEIVKIATKNLSRPNEISRASRAENITEQFFKLLHEHHVSQRNASFYADKLCMTIKYLSSTLKKVTGKSINVWINEAVTLTAKIKLKSTNLTVLQISELLNFPNPSFFGRYFRQYAGMTPLEYRDSK